MSDFDLAEMDTYALTPEERRIIAEGIATGGEMTDSRLGYLLNAGDTERLLRLARHHVLLAKRALAFIDEYQIGFSDDFIAALRTIVTDPSSA